MSLRSRIARLEKIRAARDKEKPANTQKSGKRKPTKTAWKPGQSGNPHGRPKEGESWAAIIKEISDMTPAEIINLVGKDNDLGKQIAKLPKNIVIKKLVVARVMAALMFEPTSSLWGTLMERADGKLPQPIQGAGREGEVILVVRYENRKHANADE